MIKNMTTKNEVKKFLEKIKGDKKTLTENDKFKFQCDSCGVCCHNQNIILTPLDILRFRRALNKTTIEIMAKTTTIHQGDVSRLPICMLKFISIPEETGKKITICPFLKPEFYKELNPVMEALYKQNLTKEEKDNYMRTDVMPLINANIKKGKVKQVCSIQKDKPTVCRLYPLGRVFSWDKEKGKKNIFYFSQDRKILPCKDECFEKEVLVKDFLKQNNVNQFGKLTERYNNQVMMLLPKILSDANFEEKDNPDYLLLATFFYNFDIITSYQAYAKSRKTNTTAEKFKQITDSATMSKVLGDVYNKLPNLDISLFAKSSNKNATDEDIAKVFSHLIDIYEVIIKEFRKKYVKNNSNKINKTKP